MTLENGGQRRGGSSGGVLLLACVAVVLLWELAALRSTRPWAPFELSAVDFVGFGPQAGEWKTTPVAVDTSDANEPNILACKLRRKRKETGHEGTAEGRGMVLARLVHGYNMPACMKLKGYHVALLFDGSTASTQAADGPAAGLKPSDEVGSSPGRGPLNSISNRVQLWRLTSTVGDTEIWATSIIRATDFGVEDMDIRDIAFPRVAVGDDVTWESSGIRLSSLRHPIRNMRKFFARQWSNARCDLLVFLHLKQPPWASRRLLTVVSAARAAGPDGEKDAETAALDACGFFCDQLRDWHRERPESAISPGNAAE